MNLQPTKEISLSNSLNEPGKRKPDFCLCVDVLMCGCHSKIKLATATRTNQVEMHTIYPQTEMKLTKICKNNNNETDHVDDDDGKEPHGG